MAAGIVANCQVCRVELEQRRAGSRYDARCNSAINPRDLFRSDPPGWETREENLRDVHQLLRGGRPGWGRYELMGFPTARMALEGGQVARELLELDDNVAPIFGAGGMGRRRARK